MNTNQVDVSLKFVAAGVNRVVNALDWGPQDLLAYASHNVVAVYNFQEAKILGTLLGHTDQVTSVKWIPSAGTSGGAWLLSGSADNTIRFWHWAGIQATNPWTCRAVLQGHTAAVSSLSLHQLSDERWLLASTAGEKRVLLWEGGQVATTGEWHWGQVQELYPAGPNSTCVPMCTAMSHMPGKPDWLVLAVGGTDTAVRLLLRAPGGEFKAGCALLGAESWVRALAFKLTDSSNAEGGALLLASACQDRYLRVWVVEEEGAAAGGVAGAAAATTTLSTITRFASKPALDAGDTRYTVSLEGVLLGHEDWVHSVCWQQPPAPAASPAGSGDQQQPRADLRLLSASMDRTMIVWSFDPRSQLWMNQASVGDAGATCLGYYGGVFSPDGAHIVAHGFTGALHLWSWDSVKRQWAARHALGGHWAPVTDCSWGADGKCLFTVSADQTARVFSSVNGHWCEMARPQVHGHDLRCLASLPSLTDDPAGPSYVYASGSEEKVVRVFEAPQAFLDTLAMARGADAVAVSANGGQNKRSLGAALPALGLSNKAVYLQGTGLANGGVGSGMDGGSYTEGPDFVPCASPAAVAGPPLEEHLSQNTLWPEVHKLYGHGNDLFCMTADPMGRFLVSACVAKAAAAAAVWVWSIKEWKPLGQCQGHTLTVTQMEFSHDGQYLLTASRDRSFCIFRVENSDPPNTSGQTTKGSFQLVRRCKSAHARVIWGVSWSPDDQLFATCSRDQTVKLWTHQHAAGQAQSTSLDASSASLHTVQLPKSSPPCAVAFAPAARNNNNTTRYMLAVGREDGCISLLSFVYSGTALSSPETLWESTQHTSHAAAISKLRWRVVEPAEVEEGLQENQDTLQLASSSIDHSLRVFQIRCPRAEHGTA